MNALAPLETKCTTNPFDNVCVFSIVNKSDRLVKLFSRFSLHQT